MDGDRLKMATYPSHTFAAEQSIFILMTYIRLRRTKNILVDNLKKTCKPNFFKITLFIFNKIKLGQFLPRVMLYELILINEIEQRAKIIFLSVCFKWILSKPSVFTYCVCIWSFGRTRSSKCTLLVCFGARRARAHTHTRAQTHTHAHTLQPEEQHLSCGLYFPRFIIKHVQQFSNCKDGILQQSTDDWSDSEVKVWSGRNECVPLWREGSCARRNTAIIFRS